MRAPTRLGPWLVLAGIAGACGSSEPRAEIEAKAPRSPLFAARWIVTVVNSGEPKLTILAVAEGDGIAAPRAACHRLGESWGTKFSGTAGIAANRDRRVLVDGWLVRPLPYRAYGLVTGEDGIDDADALQNWRDGHLVAALHASARWPALCFWSIWLRPLEGREGSSPDVAAAGSSSLVVGTAGVANVEVSCPVHGDAVLRLGLPDELVATPAARRETAERLTRLLACALHDHAEEPLPRFDVLCPHRHRVRITPAALVDPQPAARDASTDSR